MSLFATEELDERFVLAVEKIADAFAIKNAWISPDGGVILDANFAEVLCGTIQKIADSHAVVAAHTEDRHD